MWYNDLVGAWPSTSGFYVHNHWQLYDKIIIQNWPYLPKHESYLAVIFKLFSDQFDFKQVVLTLKLISV